MKNVVKRSVIFLSIMSIFAYAMVPESVNNYQSDLDIQVKKINIKK